ncbi:MAG: hypothetical protein ACREFI_04440, partial [Stellaceae bacterium]
SKIASLAKDLAAAQKKSSPRASQRFFMLPEIPIPPRATPVPSATASEDSDTPEDADASPSPSPVDRMAAFKLAVDAQKLRASQSRAALVDGAGLDPAAQAKMDAVIQRMNADLATHADEIAQVMEQVNDGEDPDPLEMLTISRDVSTILVDAQTSFQGVVGNPDGVDPTATQVWNYVDLSNFQSVIQNLPGQHQP